MQLPIHQANFNWWTFGPQQNKIYKYIITSFLLITINRVWAVERQHAGRDRAIFAQTDGRRQRRTSTPQTDSSETPATRTSNSWDTMQSWSRTSVHNNNRPAGVSTTTHDRANKTYEVEQCCQRRCSPAPLLFVGFAAWEGAVTMKRAQQLILHRPLQCENELTHTHTHTRKQSTQHTFSANVVKSHFARSSSRVGNDANGNLLI